jgi:hypothetical protein
MEDNTDWGIRRKGAFRDSLLATERLIDAGISPRWQLFITKRCLRELDDFLRLIDTLDLHKRCEAIGGKFEVFINGISPEGNGYALADSFIDEDDLPLIPRGLISISRDCTSRLGQPEYVLYESMLRDDSPPNLSADVPCVSVNADFDVYPNIAEPAAWWRLGNLKIDGVEAILKAYRNETTPGMTMNRELPIAELARRYGRRHSKTLYDTGDLIRRFMHQWGIDYRKGK